MAPDPEELQLRLRTRIAELAAAHKRIDEMREKIAGLKETKQKLKTVREERDALRHSAEYRLGHKILRPFQKLLGKRPPEKKTATAAAGTAPARISYHQWRLTQIPSESRLREMSDEARRLPDAPLISIVMPVFNTPEAMLAEAIESVRAQAYEKWELLIVDDASAEPHIPLLLEKFSNSDPRIKTHRLDQNTGIAMASNAALAMATGDFVAFLDHDDWLEPDALFEMARVITSDPEADFIYSDEDKVDEAGYFQQPFFKPDWSPDTLLSCNYCCHFTAIRGALLTELRGFRAGFDGAQDYDLFLRATERARRIAHIPRVLYHWRISDQSTSRSSAQKPAAIGNAAKAVEEALRRRGLDATVEPGAGSRFRVKYAIKTPPLISIIIPTRDHPELLTRCLETLEQNTDWPSYEVIIVDNDSTHPDALRLLRTTKHRVAKYEGPFNFSAICNFGARQSKGDMLLFLNNDTEFTDPEWLSAMAEHAQRPEVGTVGAMLLFPNGLVQHAGVGLADTDAALETYFNYPADSFENGGMLQMICNYSAVTAACMLMRRPVFEEAGGFDEEHFAVSFNDVDLCLKIRQRGYSIVYTPHARLVHHKAASRGYGRSNPAESRQLREKWPAILAHDPFNNPNLTRRQGAYGPLER
jgi:GT2 family glycosyltransferase